MKDIIDLAIGVAARAHAGQVRKGTDIPYISHPVAVGMLLAGAGCSDEVVAAGILHDTVEDTELTLADIRQLFGPQVETIVAGASEPDRTKIWEDRKQHTIEFLKTAPLETRYVTCADKLHNLRGILREVKVSGDQVWSRFSRGKAKQIWYYSSVLDSLKTNWPETLRPELFGSYEDAVAELRAID